MLARSALSAFIRTAHTASLPRASSVTSSAWITQNKSDADPSLTRKEFDVERLFTDEQVQNLLFEVTGIDITNKVFRPRRTHIQQRSFYGLMTDERLQNTMERMTEEGKNFLQFFPIKEPRSTEVDVLATDKEIAGFDSSKFVFTDITFDATDLNRTVVVREVDGTLRTATPEEHDRMNRVFYAKPNRPVNVPAVFSDPWLSHALDRNEHEFVLDWAVWYFEADDPQFVSLTKTVFDRIVDTEKFDILHSTRHFGPMVFYLALNGRIAQLLNHFGGQGMIHECACLIRLQKTLYPDWRVAVGSQDSDLKIVNDFIQQNARFKPQLTHLLQFLKDGTVQKPKELRKTSEQAQTIAASGVSGRVKTRITHQNVSKSDGPLGELSEEYSVRVEKGEDVSPDDDDKPRPPRGGRGGRRRK